MPTAIFEKDPTPPSTLHQNAPIVIPDGTWLATTLQLNNLIDRTGGLYALDGQRVLVTDAFGNMEVSAITTTEIGYLSVVTSNYTTTNRQNQTYYQISRRITYKLRQLSG